MIIFRVDSSAGIGSGHTMRCLTLAQEFKKMGLPCHFVVKEYAGDINHHILDQSHTLSTINNSTPAKCSRESQEADARSFIEKVNPFAQSIKIIVVDNYQLDSIWEVRVQNAFKHVKVFVIDDLRRIHKAQYLLDQTYEISTSDYNLSNISEKLLLGLKYALIREEFSSHTIQSHNQCRVRVLITMGGTDPNNATLKIAACLHENLDLLSYIDEFVFLIPQSFKYQKKTIACINKMNQKKFKIEGFVSSMPSFLNQFTLCIGAAGTSTWERFCVGLPTLLVCIADNQRFICQILEKHGLASVIYDDEFNDISIKIEELFNATSSISSEIKKLCDGLGAKRVAREILNMDYISLRSTTFDDLDITYAWQAQPETRKYARNQMSPTFSEHEKWFTSTLSNPNCLYYIIEYLGISTGMVRLDKIKNNFYEISILIDPNFYGLGVASGALKILADQNTGKRVRAFIFEQNIASVKTFLKAGFEPLTHQWYERIL